MAKKILLLSFIVFSTFIKTFAFESETFNGETPPTLLNFRISNSDPTRIYFNSSEVITASSVSGFILNDNSISSVFINSNSTENHYFKVSDPFKWYSNNAIRYVGGSNFKNSNSVDLRKFDLQYIKNNIAPPESNSNTYYVDASVSSSGDGRSKTEAFKTIKEAIDIATAGSKIWVKAGNYGRENITYRRSGNALRPISIEGYREQEGDINSLYYEYGDGALDPSEMPLLDGGNRGSGVAMHFRTNSFIILKNFQFTNYRNGIKSQSLRGIILENLLLKDLGDINSNKGTGIQFDSSSNNASYNRFKNCLVINATIIGFMVAGQNNLIENCKAFSNEARNFNDIHATTDYYFTIRGNGNILRNNLAHKDTQNGAGHNGHGFALKATDMPCEYNLVEFNTSINIYGAYEARHPETKYNVFRDIISHADVPNRRSSSEGSSAIQLLTGAEGNIFERVYGYNLDAAILFGDNTEDNTHVVGKNNIIKNCVFNNVKAVIKATNVSRATSRPVGNKIYNNTFNNADFLFSISNSSDAIVFSNNQWVNNIFNNVRALNNPKESPSSGWSYEYNNFSNGFAKLSGTGNISVDPKFENEANANFNLKSDSELINAGKSVDVILDYNKAPRPQAGNIDIGAFEKVNTTVSSINLVTGEDKTICLGEKVIIDAQGEGDFLWSTGETDTQIEVSPTETTEYTITISNGSESETGTILVTVLNLPSVTLGDDISLCETETITLTAEGEGDFLWSTGETTSSIEVSPIETTTYSVVASNSCGSSVSDEIVVTIQENFTVNAGADMDICEGSTVTLTATGSGDFLWSTGETTASIEVTPSETTEYTVTSTLNSCTISDSVILTVSGEPEVTLGDDISICGSKMITLTAEGEGDFLWSTGETSASIEVTPSQTTTYTVEASNSCGATASDEIIVTVENNLSLSAGDDLEICEGETVTLTATGSGDFLWSTGETTASIDVSPLETTEYTVTMNVGGCEIDDRVLVSVSPIPTVNLGDDITLCGSQTITLTAEGEGDFLWSTGETTQSIEVTPTETTTYSIEATSNCGTMVNDEIIVSIEENLSVNAGADIELCEGNTVTLTAQGTGNFLWSTGETSASIEVSPSQTTEYNVQMTVGECTVDDNVIVTVSNMPSVDLGDDIYLCAVETITLTAQGEGDFLWSTGETTSSIEVTPSDTAVYSVTAKMGKCEVSDQITVNVTSNFSLTAGNDVEICEGEMVTLTAQGEGDFLWSTGETTASIQVSPSITTEYSVISTLNSCTLSDAVEVVVNSVPSVDLGDDISLCEGDVVTLTAQGSGDFLWSTGETTKSITVNPTQDTFYSVTLSNNCGINSSDEIKVSVASEINLAVTEDVTICRGETIVLSASSNGEDFLWSTGERSSSIEVSPSETTSYDVTAVIGSCSITKEIVVAVNETPSVNVLENREICFGETITLTAEGSGDFLWSTGETTMSIEVSPTETSNYSVVVSNSCGSVESQVTVLVNDPVSANAGEDVLILEGDSVVLTATGGEEYLWNTGETSNSITVSPEETSTYSVIVTNGNCSDEDSVIVSVKDIKFQINSGVDLNICKNDEVVLTINGVEGEYLWSTGETSKSITVKPESTQTYSVTRVSKSANSKRASIKINVNDACLNAYNYDEFKVFPNPAKSIVKIFLPIIPRELRMTLVSVNGKVLIQKDIPSEMTGTTTQLDLSRIPRGVYFVRIHNDIMSETRKILVI